MSSLKIDSVAAVIPVKNQAAADAWYEKLLGREPDLVPVEGVTEWQIAENAWLQVTTDPDVAGKGSVIFGVSDIDAVCTACAEAGVLLGEVVEYPGLVKTVEAVDPEGNKVFFAQEISG